MKCAGGAGFIKKVLKGKGGLLLLFPPPNIPAGAKPEGKIRVKKVPDFDTI